MPSFRYGALAFFPALFDSGYAAVSASNAVQTSILSQQAYNLCLFEKSIGAQNETCTSFGVSGMPPVKTVVTGNASTATFVASFLTEFGGLGCPGTTITTTDSKGAATQLPVGELGQVWTRINSTANVPYPAVAPRPPVVTNTGSTCGSAPSSSSSLGVQSTSSSRAISTSSISKSTNSTRAPTGSTSSVVSSSSSVLLSSTSSRQVSSSSNSTQVSTSSSSTKGSTNSGSSSTSTSSLSISTGSSSSGAVTKSFSSTGLPPASSSTGSGTTSQSSSSLSRISSSTRGPGSSSSSQSSSAGSSSSTSSPLSPPSSSSLPPITTTNTNSQNPPSSSSSSSSGSGGVVVLPTITSFSAPVSTVSTSTINEVTTNQIYTTRDSNNNLIPILLFFPCLIFCGGGAGVIEVFGVGPAPGIYFPPGLPPIKIGPDNIPTLEPSLSTPTPSQTSNGPSTTSKPTSTTSSSSSCGTRTASACSTQCVNGGTCTTTCSAVATGCSATCTGTSCSNSATITFAPWTTGNTNDQDWVAATEYDSAAATSVASGIDALLSSLGMFDDNSTDSTTTPSTSIHFTTSSAPITTFSTSTLPRTTSATGSLVSGTSYGPGNFCQGLSPGGGDSCITIPAGCYIAVPSFNVVPDVTCSSTLSRTSFTGTATPIPSSSRVSSTAVASSTAQPACKTAADCGTCPLAGEVAKCLDDGTCSCATMIS